MKRTSKAIIAVIVIITLIAGSMQVAEATVGVMVSQWSGAILWDASHTAWTAVKSVVTGCQYYCASAWSASSMAASQMARILGTGLYYGALGTSAAVSAYMLYKGLEYIDGKLYKPGPSTYSCALRCGTSPMTISGVRYDISIRPYGDTTGTPGAFGLSDAQRGTWGWNAYYWSPRQCSANPVAPLWTATICMSPTQAGFANQVAAVQNKEMITSPDAATTLVQTDLEGLS